MRRVFLIAAITFLLGNIISAQPDSLSPQGRTYVEFQPISAVTARRGQSTPVQFTFRIKNGYHINSSKPLSPELIPTSLGFSPPPDVVIAKVQFPEGQLTSFPFDPTQKLSVYSGDMIVKAIVLPTKSASAGTYTVHAEFKYQACDNNSCYPPKKLPVQFDVKIPSTNGASGPRIH